VAWPFTVLLFCVGGLVAAALSQTPAWLYGAGAVTAAAAAWALVRWLQWRVDIWVVTDSRVIDESTWIPGPALRLILLCTIRTWLELNTPIPSPSGGMLRLEEPFRITIFAEANIAMPKERFLDVEMSRKRTWRALPASAPKANPCTEPCTTVTRSWPRLTTPSSQNSVSGLHPGVKLPSPSTVW